MYLALYARRAWVIFDHPYNADSARVRFLAERVAGDAPITSLCAWLGLRLRGRNVRPVSRDWDFPVGGQPISLWRTGYVRADGRLISRKRVAGDGVNPVGMGCLHRSRRHQPPESPLGVGRRANSSAGDVRPSCRFRERSAEPA